uniref:NADH dehydrogenase subunit 2 n=1 Tax=Paranauphoeta nigra TaxID=3035034 RepID=UPI0027A1ADEC|nr:NADH dehydrogenase subunit 2 [Paranauphoeta nigra]WGO57444.1 NADH dehydrogenase subunit 2 [Paranauphoeta nigra]
MLNTSTKILLTLTLLSGLIITISSNSWLSAWMGLEINLLSFIPLMSNSSNIYTTEASLKYFLVQALASSVFLFTIVSKSLIESMFVILNPPMTSIMISTPLLMKSGAAPLHWWFPSVMEGLSWMNCFILMTIQKISPLLLISYTINCELFLMIFIILSVIVGSLGGYNQISLRKILTYSSINHMGWMLVAMLMSEQMWMLYFLIYSLLTLSVIMLINPHQISFINQTFMINKEGKVLKFLLFSSLLSLGGLPPFLGFLPKWLIIQFMMINWSYLTIIIMVVVSLITLYYYLRVSYSSFIILNSEINWKIHFNGFSIFTLILGLTSMLGMILSMVMTNLLA